MASLTGNQINQTYEGLIKTIDNAIIGVTEKQITDGEGNSSTLSLGTTSASFTGDLDLSAATVTGLNSGVTSIIAGSGVAVDTSTGDVTVSSTGVNSIIAGSGITVDTSTGDVTVSSTGVNSIIAGSGITVDTSTGDVTVTATAAEENYFGTKAYVNPQGFPASAYYFLTMPTTSAAADPAVDQNDNTAILSRFFPNAGIPITEWVIPIYANGFTGNYDLEVAVYDVIAGTNEPGNQLFSTPLTIALTGSNVYHNHVFVTPFTPTTSNLYIAIQSTNSGTNNVKVGMMGSNRSLVSGLVHNFAQTGPGTEQRGINSLYFNSGNLPAAFTAGQAYGHRDEFLVLGYR